MERKKEDLGRVEPYVQQVIDPGYTTGKAVFLLTKKSEAKKAEESARRAKELYKQNGLTGLAERFSMLKETFKLVGLLAIEKQLAKNKEEDQLTMRLAGPKKEKNGYTHSICGDSDMDDTLAETMQVQGPLSKSARMYLRMVASDMRDTDAAIDLAIRNGDSDMADRLADHWNVKRGDMMAYLTQSKIRVFPMRQKDKQKAIDRAEAVDYKTQKSKGIKRPKTRGMARELTREKDSY